MNTTQTATAPREIFIKLDRNGKRRARYMSRRQFRTFPMPIDEADLMIATGQAVLVEGEPITSTLR